MQRLAISHRGDRPDFGLSSKGRSSGPIYGVYANFPSLTFICLRMGRFANVLCVAPNVYNFMNDKTFCVDIPLVNSVASHGHEPGSRQQTIRFHVGSRQSAD